METFPRYWPFVRGIHRSPVNSPHKGQWRGALMFSLICAWINGWVNNVEPGDLRRHRAHNEVTVMVAACVVKPLWYWSCLINGSSNSTRKDFNCLCYLSVKKWKKMHVYLMLPNKELAQAVSMSCSKGIFKAVRLRWTSKSTYIIAAILDCDYISAEQAHTHFYKLYPDGFSPPYLCTSFVSYEYLCTGKHWNNCRDFGPSAFMTYYASYINITYNPRINISNFETTLRKKNQSHNSIVELKQNSNTT